MTTTTKTSKPARVLADLTQNQETTVNQPAETSTFIPNEFFATEEEYKNFLSKPAATPTPTMESEYGPETPTVNIPKQNGEYGYGATPTALKWIAHFGGKKSDAIRGLRDMGYKPGAIAKLLHIRPQHVHNTLNQLYKGKKN